MSDRVAVSEPAAPVSTGVPNARRVLVAGAKILLALAIAGFIAYAVIGQWSQVRHAWLGLAWQSVLLSLVAAVAGMSANVMAWRASLRDLEYEVSFPVAARINFIGALGKYLPGSVWVYVMQMEFGRRAGLPRARAFLASVVAVGLGTAAALGIGTLALPSLLAGSRTGAGYSEPVRFAIYVLLALVPVAVVCSIPQVLTRLIQLMLRVLRRAPLTHRLTWPGVLRVVGWATVAWLCFGAHLWLLANAQAAPGFRGLFLSFGAFPIAMTAGLFAIFAPSGLGVREAVLVAALVPVLPASGAAGTALGIALASRMVFIVADLATAGVAALTGLRRATAVPAVPVPGTRPAGAAPAVPPASAPGRQAGEPGELRD